VRVALDKGLLALWEWSRRCPRHVTASDACRALIGSPPQAAPHDWRDWLALVHLDDSSPTKIRLFAHLRGETPRFLGEHRLKHANRHDVWVLSKAQVVERGPNGRPMRMIGTMTDVTSQRHADSRLRDKRAAELANIAKSEFLSRMSHEMRTPLNAVIGFTQLLLSRQGTPVAHEVREYAEHVLRAGEHLLNLTNDVLDLQRVEEGGVELELVDVALDSLVAEVIAALSSDALDRAVSFDNHVPVGVAVRADQHRLRQVLHNIASNAVKFNRPAGIVRWSVTDDAASDRVRLSIEDTGSGLKPAQLERLFQPFERLGRETSTIEGTGLGLILARSLAEAMGGKLSIASSVGIGTRVIVDLPIARQSALPFAQPDEPTATTAPAHEQPVTKPPASLRMLYVEDNRINAILFEEAIRLRQNVELRLAEDGAEALEHVRQWTPDVLVLDAHLPGMDGFELLAALRQQPGLNRVPAFMCSADAMPDDVQRAAQAGFTGYWAKPINIAKILSDLDRVSAGLPPALMGGST